MAKKVPLYKLSKADLANKVRGRGDWLRDLAVRALTLRGYSAAGIEAAIRFGMPQAGTRDGDLLVCIIYADSGREARASDSRRSLLRLHSRLLRLCLSLDTMLYGF
jgi:hypothetical protein